MQTVTDPAPVLIRQRGIIGELLQGLERVVMPWRCHVERLFQGFVAPLLCLGRVLFEVLPFLKVRSQGQLGDQAAFGGGRHQPLPALALIRVPALPAELVLRHPGGRIVLPALGRATEPDLGLCGVLFQQPHAEGPHRPAVPRCRRAKPPPLTRFNVFGHAQAFCQVISDRGLGLAGTMLRPGQIELVGLCPPTL